MSQETTPETSQERQSKIENHRERALQNQHRYQGQRYPADRQAPIRYDVGNRVLIRALGDNRRPFAARWRGPYRIAAIAGENTYWVDVHGKASKFHADNIPQVPRPQNPPR
ncbi:hypothetical protein HHI36_003974 [Cryptolaemus montrouzieri]|uniref:Uncharacterized protein n=1 Tax=Cryptolaemus montrouzieri TaxID=559131 RepID=A0ABD2NPW2_9CUCU